MGWQGGTGPKAGVGWAREAPASGGEMTGPLKAIIGLPPLTPGTCRKRMKERAGAQLSTLQLKHTRAIARCPRKHGRPSACAPTRAQSRMRAHAHAKSRGHNFAHKSTHASMRAEVLHARSHAQANAIIRTHAHASMHTRALMHTHGTNKCTHAHARVNAQTSAHT